MSKKTPECCKDCGSSRGEGYCQSDFRACPSWRAWFRKEWEGIQKVAQAIKKGKREESTT